MHNVIVLATSGDRSAPRPDWYIQRAADHMGASADFATRAQTACFQMHKDVVLPPLIPVPALITQYQGERGRQRDIRVYFRWKFSKASAQLNLLSEINRELTFGNVYQGHRRGISQGFQIQQGLFAWRAAASCQTLRF